MSLINEALRKAQTQRTQSPGLGSGTENQAIGYAPGPSRIGLMIGLGMSIVILIGLVAGLTILLLSKSGPQIVQEPATAEPAKPATETTAPASISESATETESVSKPSITPLPKQTPETIEQPATAPPEPSQEITDWIAQSTISGVRITTTSSKVILNNKAFVPDETVNMSLGLKILTIEPERIILIDSNGAEYVKSF